MYTRLNCNRVMNCHKSIYRKIKINFPKYRDEFHNHSVSSKIVKKKKNCYLYSIKKEMRKQNIISLIFSQSFYF